MSCPTQFAGQKEPVAIVGMGCRFAGDVRNPSELWDLLKDNRDGWRKFDHPHFSTKGFHHPNPNRPGSMSTQGGFLVEEDARLFDNAFFGITAREVETMDPSQRKLLEVVYEAFESGGETWDSVSGSRTGVYIGNFALDHLFIQARDFENPRPYAATGADTSILANRISYIFNLRGPRQISGDSLATNTACSSSMYALHMAVSAIRNGECDGAIVAAANWISDPSMQIVLDKLGALSPTSRCHTFDASADGYARGEGYAALYLKRPSLALYSGLPIRGLVRGTAVNANGRTGGITRPSASGQEDVIRKAYENAGDLPFSDTTYFECHGTGTQAGDPLEVSAVGNVFAASRSDSLGDRLLIGSIKPNLGHTEGASAIASIIKVVLSLEKGQVPPTHGVQKLNPNIEFEKFKVEVVRDVTIAWPKGRLRRASVNSFGFGGANGHCIIDHVNVLLPGYDKPGVALGPISSIYVSGNITNGTASNGQTNGITATNGVTVNGSRNGNESVTTVKKLLLKHSPIVSEPHKIAKADAVTRRLVLLPFSAHTSSSVKANIEVLSKVVSKLSLADIAYTLSCKRSRLLQRSFCVVERDDAALGLSTETSIFTSSLQTANVAFVFTGQGAQWHAMGANLFEYGVFRSAIAYLDVIIERLPTRIPWKISRVLLGECPPDHIQSPEVSQVACTAVQIGLVDLLASWSIRPVAVVGHSSGEMAAAYASGYITAAEAITAAVYRGLAVSNNTQKGAMLAVGLSVEQSLEYLDGKVENVNIAAMNSPGSVTLSGDADSIQSLSEVLTRDGVFNRILRTGGNAYHSYHMTALGKDFSDMLSSGLEHIDKCGIFNPTQRYPLIPWVSSVVPEKALLDGDITPSYWRKNLESPVRFTAAVAKMMSLENDTRVDVLVELGPHPALKGPLEQILKAIGKPAQYASALKRDQDDSLSILSLAGILFALNAGIDMAAVNSVDDDEREGALIHGCIAVDQPTYQYTYGPVSYYESRASKEFRLRNIVRHDLIGSRVPGTSNLEPQWRNVLRVKDLPWLAEHRLIQDAVFPGAGFIAMAVEAVTQVHQGGPEPSEITGYSLRKVDIKAALRIPEDDSGIEIIFSLRPTDTTTPTSSSWRKFSVSSVTQHLNEWTEHCMGFIRAESDKLVQDDKLKAEMDPRFPVVSSWYKKFSEIGIGYGPTFQPLSKLRVDPDENVAQASVALNTTAATVEGEESSYCLHPTALDATFQLGIIACYGGQVERANTAFVPVHLSQVYLRSGNAAGHGEAIAQGKIQGLRSAYVQLQMVDSDGEVILEVEKLRLTQFKESTNESPSRPAFSAPFSRLTWKPDIRSLNNHHARALFPAPAENEAAIAHLERADTIACLVTSEIYDTFVRGGNGPRPTGELSHWLNWVRKCVEEDTRPNMVEAKQLFPEQRREKLQTLYDEAGDKPESLAAKCLHHNMGEILNERKTGIDVLVGEGLLTPLYESGHVVAGSHPQLFNVIDCLAHANPNLRILEIGAGTGAATRTAMKALTGPNGIKRYMDYTYTDISAGFLGAAKEFMSGYRDIKYSVLDIEKDPLENGYEPVYDIVLACEAIHATASMERTLAHCRSLLKPGGKLVLAETTRMRVILGLLYGTLTGYWLGASDRRTEGPFMDQQTWDLRLREAGFSGTELVLDDYPAPHNTTSVLVSTRLGTEGERKQTCPSHPDLDVVHLLHGSAAPAPLLEEMASELKSRGIGFRMAKLDQSVDFVPEHARVVIFLNGQTDLFDGDEHRLKAFQHLARNAKSMLWLTADAMVQGRNPRGAFMAGLLRGIATENPASHFSSVDIDTENLGQAGCDDLVRSLVDHECALYRRDLNGESHDSEFVWQEGCMWISRIVPDAGLDTYVEPVKTPGRVGSQMLPIGCDMPVRAAFESPGILASLYFRPYTELLRPIPHDHIDVKVEAVGLNWKDLALSSGRFDAINNDLSSEYAGVVTKMGRNVAGLSVGDRVYGVGRGHFGNYTRVPAAFAQRLQPTDDLLEVATMPLVYMTAIYALNHIVRARRGQSVLIQSATGGLGLAAIKVAQSKGLDIFATVGTVDKGEFLVNVMGIPADHIFASRDTAALSRAARVTEKGGFDVILSTVAGGDFLSDSMKSLSPMGHLIDLSRVDVLDSRDLGLESFQRNANFSSFDLNIVLDNDPEMGRHLMKTVDELYRAGQIAPIHPFSVFSVSELDQALQSFSKGTHLGKLVISFQNPASLVKHVQVPKEARFESEASYIVVGGLGGLGRSIIRWMADRGAHNFLVLSRRGATTPESRLLVDTLIAKGISIEAMTCDISQKESVEATVQNYASSTNRPVKGVVHAALSLSDRSFDKLTAKEWKSGIASKTLGTVNLHEVTIEMPLDFFVMITSTESVWAPPTQSAYIACTNFQEYFARYRRRLGLPASTVAYGLVTDVKSDFKDVSVGTNDMYARNQALTATEWWVLATLEPAFLNMSGPGQWTGQKQDPLSAANLFTCLDPSSLAELTPAKVPPRWYSDERVSLIIRAIRDAQRNLTDTINDGDDAGNSASGSAVANLRRDFSEAVQAGLDARDDTVMLVTESISRTIAEMLFIDILTINTDKSIAEHGVDSLIAAELRHWFHQALGSNLQTLDLLDAKTSIATLAENLVDKALGQ